MKPMMRGLQDGDLWSGCTGGQAISVRFECSRGFHSARLPIQSTGSARFDVGLTSFNA
jgi:hypothetical protein